MPAADDAGPRASGEDRWSEGDMLGEFRLLKRLGQGGMASVWLAEQTSLHRQVALKLLRPDLTSDPTYVKRFQVEAKAAAGLNHPNIVQVYVIGEAEGQHYIAQEYVQGKTLKTHLQRRGSFDLQLGLHMMRQVAVALQAAGEQGIVHRDIKPENIIISQKGEAKVADFGLAQLTQHGEKLHLTQEGVTMGTPLYMSPEQVNGKKLDVRSDLYSFGVMCYHLFAGRPPFQGETAIAVAVQHLQDQPRPLREIRPDLPQPLCDLVHRLLEKLPERRYPDAATLLEDIRKLIKAAKENGRLDQVRLVDLNIDRRPKSFAARRPWIALTLLCLLAGGLSAGAGWALRLKDPRLSQAAEEPKFGVRQLPGAREQFYEAMLRSPLSEDAFLAVIHLHQHAAGSDEWVARAREQLVFYYLRNQDRWPDARRQLNELKAVGGPAGELYATKARAGDFVLAVSSGDLAGARQILSTSLSKFEKHGLLPTAGQPPGLRGGWPQLIRQAQDRLRDQEPESAPPPV